MTTSTTASDAHPAVTTSTTQDLSAAQDSATSPATPALAQLIAAARALGVAGSRVVIHASGRATVRLHTDSREQASQVAGSLGMPEPRPIIGASTEHWESELELANGRVFVTGGYVARSMGGK